MLLQMALFYSFLWLSSISLYICTMSLGVPCGSAGKESACNEGDLGSIPGLARSPGEGSVNLSNGTQAKRDESMSVWDCVPITL